MTTTGAAIEAESFRILADRVDLSHYERRARLVVARVIHASADLDYASTMVVDDRSVLAGVEAIATGAPVITDVEMTRYGISGVAAQCFLGQGQGLSRPLSGGQGLSGPLSGEQGPSGPLSGGPAPTRSAAGITVGAERYPRGTIVVIGCAPTALEEVVRLYRAGRFEPALVIGLPVGFVGAADAKQALRSTGIAAVSNIGEKGGSAVASAALNAIVRLAAGA